GPEGRAVGVAQIGVTVERTVLVVPGVAVGVQLGRRDAVVEAVIPQIVDVVLPPVVAPRAAAAGDRDAGAAVPRGVVLHAEERTGGRHEPGVGGDRGRVGREPDLIPR